jgi:glucose-6-phosphate isomerase
MGQPNLAAGLDRQTPAGSRHNGRKKTAGEAASNSGTTDEIINQLKIIRQWKLNKITK